MLVTNLMFAFISAMANIFFSIHGYIISPNQRHNTR